WTGLSLRPSTKRPPPMVTSISRSFGVVGASSSTGSKRPPTLTLGSRFVTSPNSSTSGRARLRSSSSIGFIVAPATLRRDYTRRSRRCRIRRRSPAGRSGRANERLLAGVRRSRAELEADAEELVVLRDAIGAREAAGLDLAGVGRHREIRDEAVLG